MKFFFDLDHLQNFFEHVLSLDIIFKKLHFISLFYSLQPLKHSFLSKPSRFLDCDVDVWQFDFKSLHFYWSVLVDFGNLFIFNSFISKETLKNGLILAFDVWLWLDLR